MSAFKSTWLICELVILHAVLGLTACRAQDNQKLSLAQLTQKAARGQPDAQYKLGILYETGSTEVPKDAVKALALFKALADGGDSRGENGLGIAYRHGYGTPEDDQAALSWFYKAALHGLPAAQHNLSGMYASGRGTPKNKQEALHWLIESARTGDTSSQLALCAAYQNDKIVDRDVTMAYAWCITAQGKALKHPERLDDLMTRLTGQVSLDQLSEAVSLAHHWSESRAVGSPMPLHSRAFLAIHTDKIAIANSVNGQMETTPVPKRYRTPGGCESGHWVSSVLSDGEIVKLEDGSVWQIDSADTVDSYLWQATDDVTVCSDKLVNTDDESTVGAHQLH